MPILNIWKCLYRGTVPLNCEQQLKGDFWDEEPRNRHPGILCLGVISSISVYNVTIDAWDDDDVVDDYDVDYDGDDDDVP